MLNQENAAYKFDTLEECQAFVRLNYIGLYQSLDNQLATEGYLQKILDIGCGLVEPMNVKICQKLNQKAHV